MGAVQRKSLVDGAIDYLREQIRSGAWPIGTRIPSETELTEELGVSRPSLREAVRALAHLGLLETRQGNGTFVIADNATEVALRRTLKHSDELEVQQVRSALDVLAARLAAERHTPEDMRRIRRTLAMRRNAADAENVEAFTNHDIEFHVAVAAASHNTLLLGVYTSFDASIRASVHTTLKHEITVHAHGVDYHTALADAIEARDVDLAGATAERLILAHAESNAAAERDELIASTADAPGAV